MNPKGFKEQKTSKEMLGEALIIEPERVTWEKTATVLKDQLAISSLNLELFIAFKNPLIELATSNLSNILDILEVVSTIFQQYSK